MSEGVLDLLIVGAGISGIAMAIRCAQEGFGRFLILEQAESVGGTWRDNTYPGAACDVPSHLYDLSFAPRPGWSRRYAGQAEIAAYLHDLVAEHALGDRLRLGTRVHAAAWEAETGVWRVETDRGGYAARVLVCAVGGLHHPALPDLPGLARFAGPMFHSARWDHSCDLKGRHVGVIGTGASAVQFVPEIASSVGRLTLFQRSPPWILPRGDRPIDPRKRALYARFPFLRRLLRQGLFWQREGAAYFGFTRVSRLTVLAERQARRHLRVAVPDAALRAKLTPRYRLGCKRVLLSDDFYPALVRENVDVVDAPIREVGPSAAQTADGRTHPLDVLILATGFDVAGSYAQLEVTGRDGRRLAEAWRAGMDAYQGIAVHGFPNLFLLLGPNTGLGHNSVVLMVEAQVAHVIGALRHLRSRPGASLEVREEAQARFRAQVDARMRDSIWTRGGCGSWYLDAQGRNRTLWPGSVTAYRRAAGRLRLDGYETHGPVST